MDSIWVVTGRTSMFCYKTRESAVERLNDIIADINRRGQYEISTNSNDCYTFVNLTHKTDRSKKIVVKMLSMTLQE